MEVHLEKLNDIVCVSCDKAFSVEKSNPLSAVPCPHCHKGNTVQAQIGDTLLVEMIGVGGMGVVYRALDIPLQREVAVKLVKGQSSATMQRAVNEAQAQARISHPNVAQVHAIHLLGKQPVIVMELVNGGRVSQLITKDPPMDEGRALSLTIQIAGGLNAACKAGLVFGDVKPSNILLDASGVAKLTDFGLSRQVEGPKSAEGSGMNSASSTGGFGTAAYIAPEIVARKSVDHRADIYSLGVTLFQLLTGELPFVGATKTETIAARMHGEVPQVKFFRKDLHTRTNDTVARMMAFKPEARYPDYAELIADLELAHLATQGDALAELIGGPAPVTPASVDEDPSVMKLDLPTPVVEKPPTRGDKMASALFRGFSAVSVVVNRALGAGKPGPVAEKKSSAGKP